MEKLLSNLLQGHRDATELCLTVFNWSNDYDHLIDADIAGHEATAALHRCMSAGIFGLQRNRFYRNHQDELLVSLENAISSWRISTTLQHGSDSKGHEIAHVLRWIPIEFFLHCARILHGEDWVQQVGPAFWLEMTRQHSFCLFARECGG